MKKTEWFPRNSRPVHIGVYETKSPVLKEEPGWMAMWTGTEWRAACNRICPEWYEKAQINPIARVQDREWRGLAEPPHDN